jgi:hypothetical protein
MPHMNEHLRKTGAVEDGSKTVQLDSGDRREM